MLYLDFDSGVSDVNVTNRLLLFLDNIHRRSGIGADTAGAGEQTNDTVTAASEAAEYKSRETVSEPAC